ncbi:DUF1501 domain-containing protein [Vibrio maritimus]|uniref:DUF1501 domain-containing protein n=1 Tax=Vibrio maritimus TaxID=990268 RepID=UPI002DD42D47|nr:DUF1501 domain-containing protein [Vibrio maritimus]
MAQAGQDDYKALVCIFLFGGNDAYNMVIPDSSSEHDKYLAMRPGLAIGRNELLPLGIASDNKVNLGLHPKMESLVPVFNDGDATVIVNSGQLVEPIIGQNNVYPRFPEFLMAHNLQQEMWQSGAENMSDKFGWAGRMVEYMNLSGSLPPLFSLNGEQKWLRNNHVEPLVMPRTGVGTYSGLGSSHRIAGMIRHFDEQYDNLFTENYSLTIANSYYQNEALNEAFSAVGDLDGFPQSNLGDALHTTAKLISIRNDLSLKHSRQVFFVGLGGFDTHKNQANPHGELLKQVSDAMAAFHAEMKKQGISDNVTAFTMSDFGRRIMANDSGTDHGWAGHQLVVGGAVQGGRAYGNWPDLTPGSEYDYNNGRLIPEIAADQVNATLAQWFGYTGSLETLFPSLVQFPDKTVPFL